MRTITLIISIALCLLHSNDAAAASRPNIIVILADDLGFSDVGAFGSEIATPNIDRLAAGGTSVTQFYVNPRCSPTRASLLTGLAPHAAGMGFLTTPAGYDVPPGAYQGYLAHNLTTLPEALRASGYRTYMSGKWHLGEAEEHWPRQHGFDEYFGLISGASSYYELLGNQRFVRRMALNDAVWQPPAEGFYMTHAITDRAVRYLANHDDESPLFLYLAYTAPHWPLHAPAEEIAKYSGQYDYGPAAIQAARAARQKQLGLAGAQPPPELKDDGWAKRMEVYAAMVSVMDHGIGQVLEQLAASNKLDNTLILFFSDNGACAELVTSRGLHQADSTLGQRGSYRAYGSTWATVSNAPLSNHKGTTFEGGIRTPLIAHWPAGEIPANTLDQRSVISVQDIMPTLLKASGTPLPTDLGSNPNAGLDVGSVLRGEQQAVRQPMYWEHVDWRGVRQGAFKAVFNPTTDRWMLFNAASDPAEAHDISDGHEAQLEQMTAGWQNWAQQVGVQPFKETIFGKLYPRK